MKTIEIISGEQKAQFTTKSVTLDGKEFLYINMSNVTNNTADCVYTFTYDNEVITLPYNSRDAKVLNAIFSQVENLAAKKKAHEDKSEPVPVQEDDVSAAEPEAAGNEETSEEIPQNETDTAAADDKAAEKAAKKAEKERLKEEKRKEKERKKAEKAAAKAEKKDAADTDDDTDEKAKKFSIFKALNSDSPDSADDSDEETAEKKARLKKSMIVFGIIVAVIAVLSLVYFFIFGTSNEPSSISPSVTDSQTYDDIDELINDLQ